MRIYIAGHDAREAYLTELAKKKGHQVLFEGPWDVVILSLPRSDMPNDLADQLPDGQKIICGMTNESFDRMARERKWHLMRILKDEWYTQENAILSAEGAIYFAMQLAPFSLCGAKCAVLGYGRIGKALCGMLRGLGARVTVVARRAESRKEAGKDSIPLEDLPKILPEIDILFNTIPSPVLGKEMLSLVSKDALLLELASAPYGIDLPAAQQMELRAWLESGIPGRYCPQSSAAAIMNYLERMQVYE